MGVKKFTDNSDLCYSLALKKIEEQDYLFAIKLLREAIEIDHKAPHYIELAELYYKLGQYDESTATYIALSRKVFTMEVAFGILHSHQKALGNPFNPDELSIPSTTYFHISMKSVNNPLLNKIIKDYQSIALTIDEPKLINVKENKIKRNLESVKDLALKGDYSQAIILLDSIDDKRYLDKVYELKTLIYLGAEDYEEVLKVGREYLTQYKPNISVMRAVLYSLFGLENNTISPEFRNTFNDYVDILMSNDNVDALMGLYELAQMVGYISGAGVLIKKLEKKYPYHIVVLLSSIAHYALSNNLKMADKLLARANLIHPTNPLVSYYNCLRKESKTNELPSDAWLSVLNDEICGQYVNVFVLTYLKNLMSDSSLMDEDVLKTAIVYFDRNRLKDLLLVKEIKELACYKEVLIWGIENPYLGIENKVLLIELYIASYPDTSKIFAIPTELGVHCSRLKGFKDDSAELNVAKVYNGTFANLIFTVHDVDRSLLHKVIKEMFPLDKEYDIELIKATAHLLYHKIKNYELQLELVAGTYQVDVEELKNCFESFSARI